MVISREFMCTIGMGLSQIIYVMVYIPQIITNFKEKSGRGLSDLTLLGYLNALAVFAYYIFLFGLPSIYKWSVTTQLIAVVTLIGQRLYYDTSMRSWLFRVMYGSNVIGLFAFIPMSIDNPIGVGYYAGWVAVMLSCLMQLPQVFKIFRERSVIGFNILFAVFSLLAAGVELLAALGAGLPVQTVFSALRGVVIGVVWIFQFWLYR
ncbi:MAG: hypothetical protein US22_C0001G0013 [candidate division TM6 bacterium GW2011_GWF2_36_6]|nr:MAG: hypothetical protein US22_C0001G0013 [candidate division TM6 bacterium GW2011_GWF2_36_6]